MTKQAEPADSTRSKRMRSRATLCALRSGAIFLALLSATAAIAQPKAFELDDIGRMISLSDPRLSPDGKSIVVVVSKPNLKDARSDVSLVLVDVATGIQRTLTFERKGVASARWSPSGDRLAFMAQGPSQGGGDAGSVAKDSSAAPPTGKSSLQIFVLPMNGGDASPVTSVAHDVEQFSWSPDGQQIAFAMADDNPAQKEIDKHNDAFEVGNNDYLATEAPMPAHVWLVSLQGGAPRRLTSGSWSLPRSAEFSAPTPFSWSADGKSIAIIQQATPAFGDSDQSVVAVVDVETGAVRKLTTHKSLEGDPVFSPDGSRIAYWYPRDGDPNNENEIFVTPSSGGDGVDITRALDRNVARAIWLPGGDSLLLSGHDGTRVAIWVLPMTGPARKLDLGDVEPEWSFWVDLSLSKEGALAFIGSNATQPKELYYAPSVGAAPRRLTNFNHEIASRDFGRVESFSWSGPDGFQEDGLVGYPPGFSSARKYPLVLLIHGGPQAASTLSFSSLTHLLAARGYVVFRPNYRGSDNLGNAYQRAIFNDAGDGPGRDVMAGLGALEKRGFIDSSRMGVSGWSYGGYMTTWLIGHYQVWKAAVSGAAVNDLVHTYGLSDINVMLRYSFGGSPWTGKLMKAYVEQSPITYASRIKTPTLILSDTGDARVPITESYLLYHALKDNGVPVKFFAYPVAGHLPGDSVRTMDVFRRWVDWMDQYLK